MDKFDGSISKFFNGVKETYKKGREWVGVDGLLNLETSAILTILLTTVFPVNWAMIFVGIAGLAKSALDKSNGHENEMHDLICTIFGIIIGAILV